MCIEAIVQTVKDFYVAISRGDKQKLFALCDENIEWIIPGKIGHSRARIEGTTDWRICFGKLPKWKLHPQERRRT